MVWLFLHSTAARVPGQLKSPTREACIYAPTTIAHLNAQFWRQPLLHDAFASGTLLPPCILTLARLFWIRLFRSLHLYRVILTAYFLANYESVKTSLCLSNRSQLNAARQSILLTATGPGDPCYLPLSTDSFTHIHSMTLL